MGFFSNSNDIKQYKKAMELATHGNLKEASEYFNELYLSSDDLKTQYEVRIYYHLCLAIKYSKEELLDLGKAEYLAFNAQHHEYVNYLNMNNNFGARVRYNAWAEGVKDFARLYGKDIFNLTKG